MKSHTSSSTLKETLLFFKRWFAQPKQLGSLIPSSQSLARFIAKAALQRLEKEDYVLELGTGTGRFTKALLQAGLSEKRLVCVEIDESLSDYLRQQFPGVLILQGNACGLESLVPESFHRKIGVIVSGLPMLSFPLIVQQSILNGCFRVLKPRGTLLQFTYSPFSSINAQRFHMEKKRLGWVVQNFPPACVWAYEQQSRLHLV